MSTSTSPPTILGSRGSLTSRSLAASNPKQNQSLRVPHSNVARFATLEPALSEVEGVGILILVRTDTWPRCSTSLPHCLAQSLLRIRAPIPALQPDKHRRIRNRQPRLQHQNMKRLSRLVQLGNNLFVRQ